MRIDAAVRDHLLHLELSGLSPHTIRARRQVLRDLAAFTGRPLLRLTRAEILEWRRSLRIQPESVITQFSHVRAFYAWSIDMGKLRVSPAARIPVPRRARRIPRPISESDVAIALRCAPVDIRLMLALAGWLGLRCCELSGLRWESLALEARLWIIRGKGGHQRILPLSDWLVSELRRYGIQRSGHVFRRRDGGPGPVSAGRAGQMINLYLRELGMDWTAHKWRTRFASQLLEVPDVTVREVQEALGHSDLSTLSVYTFVSPRSLRRAMAALPVPDELEEVA